MDPVTIANEATLIYGQYSQSSHFALQQYDN